MKILVIYDDTSRKSEVIEGVQTRTGAATVANIFGGENIAYAVQTMEFDLTTHKLYWLGYRAYSETNIKGFIAEINTNNGRLNNETEIYKKITYRETKRTQLLVLDDNISDVKSLGLVVDVIALLKSLPSLISCIKFCIFTFSFILSLPFFQG